MPVPGQPRNPFGQAPDRILLEQPRFDGYGPGGEAAHFAGRSLRGMIQAAGQIRHLWRQKAGYAAGPPGYSWTINGPTSNLSAARGFQLTRALRYLTRSVYFGAGSDNTRLSELHTAVVMRSRAKPVTVGAGQQRGKPVTRNRLTSFGSRVPPLQNRPNQGTE